MKVRISLLFFVFIFVFTSPIVAQEKQDNDDEEGVSDKSVTAGNEQKNYYLFSARVNVTVPHPVSNGAFKKCFVGIYEASGGLNLMLYKCVFVGGAYKNGLMKITENKIANYNASMQMNNASGKIGGDLYLGEKNRVIFSAAISMGETWTHYYDLVAKDPKKVISNTSYTCSYYEPEMNLFFLVDDNFGIGATLTYTVFDHTFDPYELSLNDWSAFDKTNGGSTQFISFGFGIYYNFYKKKKQW